MSTRATRHRAAVELAPLRRALRRAGWRIDWDYSDAGVTLYHHPTRHPRHRVGIAATFDPQDDENFRYWQLSYDDGDSGLGPGVVHRDSGLRSLREFLRRASKAESLPTDEDDTTEDYQIMRRKP